MYFLIGYDITCTMTSRCGSCLAMEATSSRKLRATKKPNYKEPSVADINYKGDQKLPKIKTKKFKEQKDKDELREDLIQVQPPKTV